MEHWGDFANPCLLVATEDRDCLDEFSEWNPLTPESFGMNLSAKPYSNFCYLEEDLKHPQPHTMDFLPEWFMLRACNVLVTPSSTFSFTAGLASRNLRRFFRASLAAEGMREEDIWNTTPILHEHVKDFQHLQGITR
jgi:hypothetical protein